MRKILIILFLYFTNISFSNAANIGNIEIKIIGNENLDKEFIESIIDTNTNLEDEELSEQYLQALHLLVEEWNYRTQKFFFFHLL